VCAPRIRPRRVRSAAPRSVTWPSARSTSNTDQTYAADRSVSIFRQRGRRQGESLATRRLTAAAGRPRRFRDEGGSGLPHACRPAARAWAASATTRRSWPF
jgi:hypothetical protein